jgi:transposase InsO family protein
VAREDSKDDVNRTRLAVEERILRELQLQDARWFLSGEIFYSNKEQRVLADSWRNRYNTIRSHSSLGYKPPASADGR